MGITKTLFAIVLTDFQTAGCQSQGVRDAPVKAAAGTFAYECDDKCRVIACTWDNTVWLCLPSQGIQIPGVPSSSGAKYSRNKLTLVTSGDHALLQMPGAIEPSCRNTAREASGEHARLTGVDLRATRNDPDWHLELIIDGEIVSGQDHQEPVYRFETPVPVIDQAARMTAYFAETGNDKLMLNFEDLPCRNALSGSPLEITVRVQINGNSQRGCGKTLH